MMWMALLPLLAQATPGEVIRPGSPEDVTGLPGVVLERERAERERRAKSSAQSEKPLPPLISKSELIECLRLAERDPDAAEDYALNKLMASRWDLAAAAGHCLGFAASRRGDWAEARDQFHSAWQGVPEDRAEYRAALAAMEGNAALAGGDNAGAIKAFTAALNDAEAMDSAAFTAAVKRDYARALVGEGKGSEAAAMLAEAVAADPKNSEGWLLSATLARRMERLAEAQSAIEQAARFAPRSAEVALEAGRIAMLAGKPAAARKSWESALAIAQQGPLADYARSYIAAVDEAAAKTPDK